MSFCLPELVEGRQFLGYFRVSTGSVRQSELVILSLPAPVKRSEPGSKDDRFVGYLRASTGSA
jgi:hypothetical protein